jgi:hypothetical protein
MDERTTKRERFHARMSAASAGVPLPEESQPKLHGTQDWFSLGFHFYQRGIPSNWEKIIALRCGCDVAHVWAVSDGLNTGTFDWRVCAAVFKLRNDVNDTVEWIRLKKAKRETGQTRTQLLARVTEAEIKLIAGKVLLYRPAIGLPFGWWKPRKRERVSA